MGWVIAVDWVGSCGIRQTGLTRKIPNQTLYIIDSTPH